MVFYGAEDEDGRLLCQIIEGLDGNSVWYGEVEFVA
jgi:hypothetical protein